jgi:hypothetical protein
LQSQLLFYISIHITQFLLLRKWRSIATASPLPFPFLSYHLVRGHYFISQYGSDILAFVPSIVTHSSTTPTLLRWSAIPTPHQENCAQGHIDKPPSIMCPSWFLSNPNNRFRQYDRIGQPHKGFRDTRALNAEVHFYESLTLSLLPKTARDASFDPTMNLPTQNSDRVLIDPAITVKVVDARGDLFITLDHTLLSNTTSRNVSVCQ